MEQCKKTTYSVQREPAPSGKKCDDKTGPGKPIGVFGGRITPASSTAHALACVFPVAKSMVFYLSTTSRRARRYLIVARVDLVIVMLCVLINLGACDMRWFLTYVRTANTVCRRRIYCRQSCYRIFLVVKSCNSTGSIICRAVVSSSIAERHSVFVVLRSVAAL